MSGSQDATSVRHEVVVEAPVDRAFAVFVEDIDKFGAGPSGGTPRSPSARRTSPRRARRCRSDASGRTRAAGVCPARSGTQRSCAGRFPAAASDSRRRGDRHATATGGLAPPMCAPCAHDRAGAAGAPRGIPTSARASQTALVPLCNPIRGPPCASGDRAAENPVLPKTLPKSVFAPTRNAGSPVNTGLPGTSQVERGAT